ncbi:MAG: Sensor histidine kinase RcsC [Acidobacteria bacterium]|nr:Sensor histidine kinase RcsC [Acidobacteriota bacterium]
MSTGSQNKVLIIADELLIRWTLAEALRGWGYQPVEAGSAATALALFDSERPAAALLDLTLPDGFGLDALREINRRQPDAPVIIITTNPFAGESNPDLYRSACELLEKPINLARLRDVLNHRIRQAASSMDRKAPLLTEQWRGHAALLEHASDAVIARDLQDCIIYWNKGAERYYGWTAEEALGANIERLLYPRGSQEFTEARRATIERGEWRGELRQTTKGGCAIISECHWTLVRDDAGNPQSIVVINYDITEKKRLEARRLHARHLNGLGALAGGIAHNLNNLLTPVLSAVQLLQMKYTDVESQRMLTLLQSNVERSAELLKQLTVFAMGDGGKQERLQPGNLIAGAVGTIRGSLPDSISLRCQIADGLGEITGDGAQLRQMLISLCANAREAMPFGGLLTIAGANVTLDETAAMLFPEANPGKFLLLSVSDTGVGIPPEIRERIFDPFFTTKGPYVGVGLGLSAVLGIVRSHRGFINVESEPGQGSRFSVYLPTLEDAACETSPA